MNQERLEALLWERIDGTITDEDLAELEAALAEHPRSRAVECEVARLAEQLGTVAKVHPPAELRAQIDNALANARAPIHQTPPPRLEAHHTHGFGWSSRWLPVAASLLVGVALGYLLHPRMGATIEGSRAAGTMTGPLGGSQAPSLRIALGDQAGTVVFTRTGGAAMVELDLAADIEVGVTLVASNGALALTEIEEGASAVRVSGGTVRFLTRGPDNHRFEVTAGSPAAALRVEVTVDGQTVARHVMEAVAGGDHP